MKGEVQMNKLVSKVIILIVILLSVLFITYCDNSSVSREALKMGISVPQEELKAPDVRFDDLNEESHYLSDYKGDVIVLNLWATWCVPCKLEMPSLNRLHNKYKDKGLKVIAINIEEVPSVEKINKFAEDSGIEFFLGLDSYATVSALYFTGSVPSTFVIDKDFNIVGKVTGTADWSTSIAYRLIENLLAE